MNREAQKRLDMAPFTLDAPRTREDMDTALEAFRDELSKQASIEEPMSRARARHYVMTLIDNELSSRKNDKESLIKAGYEKEVE